jgi:hypothetical protein
MSTEPFSAEWSDRPLPLLTAVDPPEKILKRFAIDILISPSREIETKSPLPKRSGLNVSIV